MYFSQRLDCRIILIVQLFNSKCIFEISEFLIIFYLFNLLVTVLLFCNGIFFILSPFFNSVTLQSVKTIKLFKKMFFKMRKMAFYNVRSLMASDAWQSRINFLSRCITLTNPHQKNPNHYRVQKGMLTSKNSGLLPVSTKETHFKIFKFFFVFNWIITQPFIIFLKNITKK